MSWNLLTLLSGPASIAAAEAQQDLGETRRLALSMATLTQVHVGYQQYQRARRNFEQAELLNSIEQRIYDNTRNAEAGDAQNVLERVRAAASAISSELLRDRAYADVQAATANLVVSLGSGPAAGRSAEPRHQDAVAGIGGDERELAVRPVRPAGPVPLRRLYRCRCRCPCRQHR